MKSGEAENKILIFRENHALMGRVLTIKIPEELLVFACESNPEVEAKVTDKDKFLNYIANHLVEDIGYNSETGVGSFYRLLDEAAIAAIEDDAGIVFKGEE